MSRAEVHMTFFDTTARDGAQALPEEHQFEAGAKPDLVDHIARLGVGVIEAGFPATPDDGAEVAQVARTVGRRYYPVQSWQNGKQTGMVNRPPVIAGLSRATEGDIDATWAAVGDAASPRIHTFISTSDQHREAKFPGVSRDELITIGERAVCYAADLAHAHPRGTVEFSAEAASTTDVAYLERVVRSAIDAGADVINLPDTVGERDPRWMYDFYTRALGWVHDQNPDVVLSAHNHNDMACAVPNTIALAQAAEDFAIARDTRVAIQVETTICGLGERAGNADIFPVLAMMHRRGEDMQVPVTWEANPGYAVGAATAVMGMARLVVPRQNPIVGSDINAHRSGIHSDGVIKGGHRIYTPFDPRFWGHCTAARHEEGRYQGRAGRVAARATASS